MHDYKYGLDLFAEISKVYFIVLKTTAPFICEVDKMFVCFTSHTIQKSRGGY